LTQRPPNTTDRNRPAREPFRTPQLAARRRTRSTQAARKGAGATGSPASGESRASV